MLKQRRHYHFLLQDSLWSRIPSFFHVDLRKIERWEIQKDEKTKNLYRMLSREKCTVELQRKKKERNDDLVWLKNKLTEKREA